MSSISHPRACDNACKSLALFASFLTFLLSLLLLKMPETNLEGPALFSHLEVYPWIATWNVFYRLGVDTLAIAMVILSTALFPIALLASWRLDHSVKGFFLLFLLLESAVIGAFVSLDLVLFYVFWEAMLIPMFMLIGIWGGKSRIKTSMKFFIFTFWIASSSDWCFDFGADLPDLQSARSLQSPSAPQLTISLIHLV